MSGYDRTQTDLTDNETKAKYGCNALTPSRESIWVLKFNESNSRNNIIDVIEMPVFVERNL